MISLRHPKHDQSCGDVLAHNPIFISLVVIDFAPEIPEGFQFTETKCLRLFFYDNEPMFCADLGSSSTLAGGTGRRLADSLK